MFYREWDPGPALTSSIKCIWALERDYRGPVPEHEHLWADANGELIFRFGSPYYVKRNGRRRILPEVFVIGPCTRSFDLYSDGATALVGVRFFPWGFYGLTDHDVPALVDALLAGRRVFGPGVEDVGRAVASLAHAERSDVVREWLITRSATRVVTIGDIGRRIHDHHGQPTVDQLAKESGCTVRQLERRFRAETGLSPKQLSRIVRFNYAKQRIQQDPHVSLADLAHDAGYTDQAHFGKSFKAMFSITPAAFKAQMIDGLTLNAATGADVAFLQDT